MCGRINVIDDPSVLHLLSMVGIDLDYPLQRRLNIAPTEILPIIVDDGQYRRGQAKQKGSVSFFHNTTGKQPDVESIIIRRVN